MKRILLITALLLFVYSSVDAQKIAIKCPPKKTLTDITACPDTGCGSKVDPHLNRQKNIRTSTKRAITRTIQDLKDLPDPVPDYKLGDTREKLEALGEGDKIRVVAYALVARAGGKESCNCDLSKSRDTDNHIVLVDEPTLALTARASPARRATAKRKAIKAKTARQNTLHVREKQSITAEFSPRVRLDHPKLTGVRLQSLIEKTPKKVLLVRLTGLLMFDSQHSLEGHLTRVNNWEIHPVMVLEFCPPAKICTADSDDNWRNLEAIP